MILFFQRVARHQIQLLLLAPLMLHLSLLLAVPVGALIYFSFQGDATDGGSWQHYARFFGNPHFLRSLAHSLALSLCVALFSTLICLFPAWLLARVAFPGKRALRALFSLPMSFSGVIVGFLMIVALGRIGIVPLASEALFGTPLMQGWAYHLGGLALAYIYFEIPRATLALESALVHLDQSWIDAARSMGATPKQILLWILIPYGWPVLLSTLLITFTVSLGSFGVALVLSRRFSVLPLEIYQEFTGFLQPELASAMSVILIGFAIGAIGIEQWLMKSFRRNHEPA